MKKFISMVMAAAMVVSLVPATAFAAESTLKVAKAVEWTEQEADQIKKNNGNLVIDGAQAQIKVKDVDTKLTVEDKYEIKLHFDNAEIKTAEKGAKDVSDSQVFTVSVYDKDTNKTYKLDFNNDGDALKAGEFEYSFDDEDTKVTITFKEEVADPVDGVAEVVDINEDDVVYIDFHDRQKADLIMNTFKSGAQATVKVTGDLGETEAKVIGEIVEAGIAVDVDDTVDVAEDEVVKLEDVTVEIDGGDDFSEVLDFKYDNDGDQGTTHAKVTLKVNSGFEFANVGGVTIVGVSSSDYTVVDADDDEIVLYIAKTAFGAKEDFVISNLYVASEGAKVGDVATLKVSSPDVDAQTVEVANVVAEGLSISVDEDEDVPVMWSGVNVANKGLNVDDTHESLEITLEESVKGAYDDGDEIEFVLPEGVYVTNVKDDNFTLVDVANSNNDLSLEDLMAAAYKEGDHESFIIEKRIIDETADLTDKIETEFTLELVADASFVGPVELTLKVDGEEINTVTIAEFKAPFVVEAAQNDLKIDYRNTEVPTDVVITEAEAGLWDKGLTFTMELDKYIEFEGDPTVVVNEDDSDMEVDVDVDNGVVTVAIDKESDDEAGVITMSDLELYMERNLPAGAYALKMGHTAGNDFAMSELYTTKATGMADQNVYGFNTTYTVDKDAANEPAGTVSNTVNLYTVADFHGWMTVANVYEAEKLTVKEGWVNIVTAGREQDDASFTTKVVVPVGESYIVAGEQTVALDVPAYVSEAGYTMLPVRAVATALGINNNNVLWDQATKTVTILYGQRIITMTVGAKVINVNGSAIPASASVEVVNGRTFLPMRDLATALGVTDITWDAATKTATLNGNV